MKRLIMINGTMGVGKTTVCQNLKKLGADSLPAFILMIDSLFNCFFYGLVKIGNNILGVL